MARSLASLERVLWAAGVAGRHDHGGWCKSADRHSDSPEAGRLDGADLEAAPELVEDEARQRLQEEAAQRSVVTSTSSALDAVRSGPARIAIALKRV